MLTVTNMKLLEHWLNPMKESITVWQNSCLPTAYLRFKPKLEHTDFYLDCKSVDILGPLSPYWVCAGGCPWFFIRLKRVVIVRCENAWTLLSCLLHVLLFCYSNVCSVLKTVVWNLVIWGLTCKLNFMCFVSFTGVVTPRKCLNCMKWK
jgi:hypothetical protein